jgi:hypothetical protein
MLSMLLIKARNGIIKLHGYSSNYFTDALSCIDS